MDKSFAPAFKVDKRVCSGRHYERRRNQIHICSVTGNNYPAQSAGRWQQGRFVLFRLYRFKKKFDWRKNMVKPVLQAKILYSISLGLSTPRSVLTALSSVPNSVYRILRKFEEDGLVCMRTFTIEKRGRKLTRKYYVITKKGVEKLLTDYLEFYPWLSGFETECATRFPLTGGAVIKPERRNRLMKIAVSTVMMNEAIGPVAPVLVEGKDIEKNTWYGFLRNNWGEAYADETQFLDSVSVKRMFRTDEDVALNDVMSDRYTGILLGTYNRALVYVPTNEGMTWRKNRVQREIQTMNSVCGMLRSHLRGSNGIVLIPNVKEFKDLYFDAQSVRGTEGAESLGSQMEHLWFVPTNYIGIGQLRRIAYEDLNAKRDEVIASAVENVGLLRNKNSAFPLMDEEGRWYAYGADLDICVVQQMKIYQERTPDMKIGIVCYQWQTAYYDQLFEDVRYLIMQ